MCLEKLSFLNFTSSWNRIRQLTAATYFLAYKHLMQINKVELIIKKYFKIYSYFYCQYTLKHSVYQTIILLELLKQIFLNIVLFYKITRLTKNLVYLDRWLEKVVYSSYKPYLIFFSWLNKIQSIFWDFEVKVGELDRLFIEQANKKTKKE